MNKLLIVPRPDYELYAEIYNDCRACLYLTREKYNAWARANGANEKPKAVTACVAHHRGKDGYDDYIAFIPLKCNRETISHECLHLAWYIIDSYGVDVSADSHEALAYLMQHLARQVVLIIEKEKRKAKRK